MIIEQKLTPMDGKLVANILQEMSDNPKPIKGKYKWIALNISNGEFDEWVNKKENQELISNQLDDGVRVIIDYDQDQLEYTNIRPVDKLAHIRIPV